MNIFLFSKRYKISVQIELFIVGHRHRAVAWGASCNMCIWQINLTRKNYCAAIRIIYSCRNIVLTKTGSSCTDT